MRLRATRLTAVASAVASLGEPNSATRWLFAQNGIEGTPWANLSRTGLGTRVSATGLVEFGPNNLLRQSDDLAASPWASGGVGGTTAATAGGVTTITLAGASDGTRNQVVTMPLGVVSWSVDLKSTIGSQATVGMTDLTSGDAAVTVRLTDGAVLNQVGAGSWTGVAVNVATLGDGWFRCTVSAARGAGTSIAAYIRIGVSADGPILAKRAQVSQGLDRTYLPTTVAARYLPRITHNPATLARLGLLVEGQTSNEHPQSNTAIEYYIVVGSGLTSAPTQADPSGSIGGFVLNFVSGGRIQRNFTPGLNIPLVWSFFARKGTGPLVAEFGYTGTFTQGGASSIDLATGAVTGGSARVIDSGPFWRIWIPMTPTVNGGGNIAYYSLAKGTSGGAHISHTQLEAATAPTSYIPVPGTGSALRAADNFFLSGADFTAAFGANSAVGTVQCEFSLSDVARNSGFPGILAISSADFTNYVGYYGLFPNAGTNEFQIYLKVFRNSVASDIPGPVLPPGGTYKLALSWDGTSVRFSTNGFGGTSAGAAPAGMSRIYLGWLFGTYLNGRIHACRTYPGVAMTVAQLNAMTV